jgi:hypothetical protein
MTAVNVSITRIPRLCLPVRKNQNPAVATSREGYRSRLLGALRQKVRRAARQDFAFNLSANRCLCNTVGGRIVRIVEGCAAYRCAVAAARFRAAAMTNLARASLALVLCAVFGGAKSCALVSFFMICPAGQLMANRQRPSSVPDHGYLMAMKPSKHPARDPPSAKE